jgi:hypothetical protein
MSLTICILRPDDLVCLTVEAVNLVLGSSDPQNPALVRRMPEEPAYLIVHFQPQAIAE